MEKEKENIDIKILMRYLKGKATSEDSAIVRRWFANSDFEHELNEKSFLFWDETPLEPDIKGYSDAHILDQIHHKIRLEEAIFLTKTEPKIRFINYLTRIAAILAVPLLIASLFFYSQNRSFRDSVSWAEIHAPYGTRTDFHLPDGSTGRLNGGSSLKYPTQFIGKSRDVELSGEAYFDVISNQRKPFIVSTGNINIKATGTSFNVMAYTDDQIIEVTLKNGKIEVLKKEGDITKSLGVLKPDESFIYNHRSGSGKIESLNNANRLSWLDGKLTFKYESFEEVIRKLNRWYNVNIVIKDESLNSYSYYATFQNETLDEVLKLLQYTAPIRYRDFERKRENDGTFEKRRIEIYSKR